MKHRHIKASRNEWIHVHRTSSDRQPDGSWIVYAIGGLIALYVIMKLLPYLLMGAVGWFFLKIWCR